MAAVVTLLPDTVSQSLWVRDRFLIDADLLASRAYDVAIPLGQGQVFNHPTPCNRARHSVAIPLGQGQVFNCHNISKR